MKKWAKDFGFDTPNTRKPTIYEEVWDEHKTEVIAVIIHPGDYPGEVNNEPSKTVPNMAMSIAEIMHRYATGRPVPRSNNLVYTGDANLPNPRALDQMETADLLRDTQESIRHYNKLLSEEKQKQKERKQARDEAKQQQQAAGQQQAHGNSPGKEDAKQTTQPGTAGGLS